MLKIVTVTVSVMLYPDSCGVCSGGNSGHDADSDQDCAGECFGDALYR